MDPIMQEKIARFELLLQQNIEGGNRKITEKHIAKGKMLPRDRITALLDPNTFVELGSGARATSERIDGRQLSAEQSPCDGAITGYGQVRSRLVALYASDFSVLAGSLGTQHITKMVKLFEYAAQNRIPIVWLLDSAGGRLGWEDVAISSLEWFFWPEGIYSGVVPQITVLMGPCIAGQAYAPCMTDFLFMTRGTAHLWLGGPRMVQAATSEKMTDDVGAGDYHMALSGTCDRVGEDDAQTIAYTRKLLGYLPSHFQQKPPTRETSDPGDRSVDRLCELVPGDVEHDYSIHDLVTELVDDGEFFELKETYAPQLVTLFAHLGGQVVGIVACNPKHSASLMTRDACDKYYRFLQVLDAYGIPLINLVDTPKILPSEEEEQLGAARHGAKIIHLYANCTIPKISVILRQSCGDAGSVIFGGVKGMGADLIYAWPLAEFSVSASRIDLSQEPRLGVEQEEYHPYISAAREPIDVFEAAHTPTAQLLDEIIHPADTRKRLLEALDILRDKAEVLPEKAKSHGTPPA